MASKIVTQTNETHINGKMYVFTWIVKNLNLDLPLKDGRCIYSPTFQIDSISCQLLLYPDGLYAHHKNHVVLEYENKIELKKYSFNVYLVNKNGNEDFHFSFYCGDHPPYSSYFYLETEKITSDFLQNGHLTMKWKLYSLVDQHYVQNSPKHISIKNIAEKRRLTELDDFETLLKDNRFSDIKIVIDKQTFFAHKSILAARSRYFAAMFESNMKEVEEGEIHITNIFSNIMQEVLRFIYTEICEEAIMSNMSLENIGSILIDIDRLSNAEKFKDSAIEFLTKNAKELSGDESFKKVLNSLSHSFVVDIMNILMSKI